MGWDDMRRKFNGLVTDRLGNRTEELFEGLRGLGTGSALAALHDIVGRLQA
jgi:hypothetical protein